LRSWCKFGAATGFCLSLVLSISAASYGISSENNSPTHGSAASRAAEQSPQSSAPIFDLTSPDGVASYCADLARGKDQAKALQAACEYALSLRWKLPNVICEQVRDRYQEGLTGGKEQENRVTAKLRYEDGKEEYSDVKLDGKPVKTTVEASGTIWSQGEFALDLRHIRSANQVRVQVCERRGDSFEPNSHIRLQSGKKEQQDYGLGRG
jgi:hypothetical protein